MGTFLKNSEDIIVDAVLTTQGRFAIAQNDSSQKITQFALFDDEIDYSLYRSKHGCFGEEHPSGSAYFDLDILQRPVLEAFTRGYAYGKSKLITINGSPEYLPVLRLNFNRRDHGGLDSRPTFGNLAGMPEYGPDGWGREYYLVISDLDTLNKLNGTDADADVDNSYSVIGENSDEAINFLNAFQPSSIVDGGCISVEHGIHFTDDWPISPHEVDEYLKGDYNLYEEEFFIQYDSRYAIPYDAGGGRAIDRVGNTFGEYDFANPLTDRSVRRTDVTDLDKYDPRTLEQIEPTEAYSAETGAGETVIKGPRSHRLNFKLGFGMSDVYSTYISSFKGSILNDPKHFEENGIELTVYESKRMFGEDVTYGTAVSNSPFYSYRYIDKEIKVFAGTTGYSITIPLRYLKLFKSPGPP